MKVGKLIIPEDEKRLHVDYTDYVVYSYDRDNFVFRFAFENYPEINGDAYLILKADDMPTQQFTLTIENKRAEWIVPERLLGYEGHVKGYLYLTENDLIKAEDAYMYTFLMRRSQIDEGVLEIESMYFEKFEDLVAKMNLRFDELSASASNVFNDYKSFANKKKEDIANVDLDISSDVDEVYNSLLEFYLKSKNLMAEEVKRVADKKVLVYIEMENLLKSTEKSVETMLYDIQNELTDIDLAKDSAMIEIERYINQIKEMIKQAEDVLGGIISDKIYTKNEVDTILLDKASVRQIEALEESQDRKLDNYKTEVVNSLRSKVDKTVFDTLDEEVIDARNDTKGIVHVDLGSRLDTNENVVSDIEVEIDEARGEASSLGERLDSEKADLTTQLAQTDLVDLLKNHNASGNKVFFRKKGLFDFSAIIPFGGNKGAVYNFKRPPIANEEYILLQDGYVSDLEKTKTIIGQDFTINKDFDSRTGDFYDIILGADMPNANNYSRATGATMTVSFNGDYIAFNAYKNSSGGVWEFVLDGNAVGKKVVSVYSPTPINAVTAVLWEGLEKTNHTVVATFVGDDPNNQPSGGVGTSRGWFKYSDGGRFESTTFTVKETHQTELDSVIESKRFDVMRDNSNKEFAIRVRPSGTSLPTEFMPGHVTTATAFANEQKLLIDGEEVTDWSLSEYAEASVIQLIQRMEVIYPSTEAHIANVYSVHTVNSEGVSVKVNIDFLQDLFCTTGYSLMFPVKNSFAKRLVTSNGDTYQSTKTDGSSTEIFENDPLSYLFYNTGGTNGEEDYAVGLTVQNPTRTYRKGKSGRRDPIAWLQHRDSDMQKVYMQVYQNTEIEAGERLSIGGTFYIGALPDAQLNFE